MINEVLHLQNLHRNICIDDMTRKRMEAHKVFTHSIKFLVNSLFERLKSAVPDITLDDIHFVVTVPAIWDDPSKQFMREAATAVSLHATRLDHLFYLLLIGHNDKVFAYIFDK